MQSTAKSRVQDELKELHEKLMKLKNFLAQPDNDAFNALSACNKELLNIQRTVMETYVTVLEARLSHWDD